ncbi:GntR family transcriptional regulator [Paenibacillus monticola]|uniref:GntR family transcriptional regulator n=1 Tax=Paenibacillus monticola TaxID=2666075 RepID=A0A7X2H718_9BACL|nr:GntR family transcriptional regulator [Paenibacillus monticola]MRN54702.1 GntR family transcriptional regulator [Paenibacillus monticola]
MYNDRQPLYVQIQEHFKNLILNNELKENDKIPSEKEVMEQFSVSRITVANALMQLAKDGWIYRVPGRGSFVSEEIQGIVANHKAVLESEFRLQIVPADKSYTSLGSTAVSVNKTENTVISLASGGRKIIGLIMPGLVDYFSIRLIQGINNILEESQYSLYIIQSFNSIEREEEAILDLIKNGAVGLIIFPCDTETYNEEILSLKQIKFPFVLIDRYFPGVETNIVRSDGMIGGKLAVDYLWDLGHRDIAICSDSPLPITTVEDRINGYMDGLKKKEALINPALILTDFHVEYKGINAEHPLYRFIKNRMATAFITLNGRLGLHIRSICRELGLRVPEDISILTFDDPSPGLNESGALTYISQSEGIMGEEAVNILLNMLEEPQNLDHKYHKVILKPELIEGESTAVCVV